VEGPAWRNRPSTTLQVVAFPCKCREEEGGACGSTSSPRTQFCSGPYFNAALLVCRLMLVAWSNSFTKIVLRSLQLRIKTYIDAVAGPAGAGNRGQGRTVKPGARLSKRMRSSAGALAGEQ
jgi:hypothetical protein